MTTKPIARDVLPKSGKKSLRFAYIQCEVCRAVRDIKVSHIKEISTIACNRCDNVHTFRMISEKEALPYLFVARHELPLPLTA